jgi:xanthine dehydrogenase YagS FAD-binding subunit
MRSATGERTVPFSQMHLEPGDTPQRETILQPGELIVDVTLAPSTPLARSYYLKLRDRASYEFALASAAVVMDFDGTVMHNVRVTLGGVATRPWLAEAATFVLEGRTPSPELFREAAQAAMHDAIGLPGNRFKIELAKRCIAAALSHVTSAAFG